ATGGSGPTRSFTGSTPTSWDTSRTWPRTRTGVHGMGSDSERTARTYDPDRTLVPIMTSITDALSTAVPHHRAGRLREAETMYRQILAADPDHHHAWHLLGVIACQAGNYQAGAECIQHALAYRPDWAAAQHNLGNAGRDQGKLDAAGQAMGL